MKIALVGYGKMGRAIEAAAKAAGNHVVATIDPVFAKATADKPQNAATKISAKTLNGAQVVIDFSHPKTILENIQSYSKAKINAVIGTTGWYDKLPQVEKLVKKAGIGLIYAGNFSVGVNTFYAIVAEAAHRISAAGGYDVGIHEVHHTGKADAPSGTAYEVGKVVLKNYPAKKRILLDNAEQPVPPEALQISSSRLGKVVGIHTVAFDGLSDSITLCHSGKNRDGYVAGALQAAKFIVGKQGIYTAKDLFRL
jgi:4-hydroxy-tetrahydrodipicolinate reductase